MTVRRKGIILVVSFGTSYNESREKTIGAIEKTIASAFPDYEVRRAFTSQMIIDKLKKRDGLEIDNVEQALQRILEDGAESLIVQPTHLMAGYEYTDLAEIILEYRSEFRRMILAEPLLTGREDFQAVIQAMEKETAAYDDGRTAICYMGHGTEAESNHVYEALQNGLKDRGADNYYIGTVEAEPTLEKIMSTIAERGGYGRIVLKPLMVVSGDHANHDMAGGEKDSWKSRFEAAGYEVTCILEGMGENPDIREIYVRHVRRAAERLTAN